jgi:hypothetical protein
MRHCTHCGAAIDNAQGIQSYDRCAVCREPADKPEQVGIFAGTPLYANKRLEELDRDEAAVQALLAVAFHDPLLNYVHPALNMFFRQESARAILAAIRSGQVPIPEGAQQLVALQTALRLANDAAARHMSNAEMLAAKLADAQAAIKDRESECRKIVRECDKLEAERDSLATKLAEAMKHSPTGYVHRQLFAQVQEQRDALVAKVASLESHLRNLQAREDEWHRSAMQELAGAIARAEKAEAGETPRRFDDWHEDHGSGLWWNVENTDGEIQEEPEYIGQPRDNDWPWTDADEPHLLWVPLPKLERGRP